MRWSLNALFNPRSLLDVQQRLFAIPDGEELVQTVLSLQSRFQDYMLPLVTLTEKDPSEVVSIFERVNSTGTKLSRVDFMRAITWSSQFDLNEALDEIGGNLKERNFDIADDTIVKALGLTFDLDPVPDVMLKLREKKASELTSSVKKTQKTLLSVINFLKTDLHILGSDFVPYEGQLLTLFNVFHKLGKVDDSQRSQLKAWFFAGSFSEALQGRPDHFVARLIRSVTAHLKHQKPGNLAASDWKLPDNFDFARKRMISGKALSTAFVSLFGGLEAKSLNDGRRIPAEEYLRTFDTNSYVPIFSKKELPAEFGSSGVSAKVFANVVLIPPSDSHLLDSTSVSDLLLSLYKRDDDQARAVLQSQLLPPNGTSLIARDSFAFLEFRAEIIGDAMYKALEAAE